MLGEGYKSMHMSVLECRMRLTDVGHDDAGFPPPSNCPLKHEQIEFVSFRIYTESPDRLASPSGGDNFLQLLAIFVEVSTKN